MFIAGLQKLTLIDYPGKIAATVFTHGCNFRCHFCHNPELIHGMRNARIPEEEFFSFLEKRKGLLDGVCVTGGEPTLQPELLGFLKKIRSLGFLVKLDSNGTNPDLLERAIKENLVQYIAMDIKHSMKKYHEAVGTSFHPKNIQKSIDLLKKGFIDYEFRTTAVPGIHAEDDFSDIARELSGAKKYFLQEYRESKVYNPEYLKKISKTSLDLEAIKKSIEFLLPGTEIGIRKSSE